MRVASNEPRLSSARPPASQQQISLSKKYIKMFKSEFAAKRKEYADRAPVRGVFYIIK